MSSHDLVVRGATVIDGTGAPRFEADVAVDGDPLQISIL
jgi:N-acyl-D-amino-acid deacylase